MSLSLYRGAHTSGAALTRAAVVVAIAMLALVGFAATGAKAQGQASVLNADFSSSADGFSYGDVSDPTGTSYVDGAVGSGRSGNGLTVTLGGINGDDISNMIGAWTNNFTLSQPAVATINVDYRIEQADPYDANEWAEVRVAVDGNNLAPSNGSFPRVTAGGTAGWATYSTQVSLGAGNHKIDLIGVNNLKTFGDEISVIRFDNVSVKVPVVATPTAIPTATSTPVPAATAAPTAIPTATPLPGPSCGGGAMAQEAEDGALSGTMQVVANSAASGNEFVQAEVGTRGRTYPNTDVAEYCVTVPTTGDYRLDATVWAPNSSDDSFYVTIDGGTMALWDMAKDPGFHDDSVSNRGGDNPVVWNLSAGDHVVRFHHREDGAGIDKFEFISLTPTAPTVANCTTGAQQAEAGALNGTMQIVADSAAASGQFVQAQIGTYGRPGPGTDYAEYCVTIPTGGDYRIDATAWAPNSADDSFYVTVNNTPHALWDMDKNPTFATSTVSDRNGADPMIWNLTPGNHTIRFHHREDGAGLDSFELVLVTPPTPTPIPPTPTPTPAPDGITLFGGTNQSGAQEPLAPGVYSGANGFSNVSNNSASSFLITPGYIALMCTNGAGTGTCRGFTNSKNNLGDFSLDNNVSYLQIRQIGEPFILAPGNDVKQMVNRLPAGMEFVFTPGTYPGQAIIAKDNTTFTGQPGAVLDGDGLDTHAISGLGDNVTIRGLEIIGYVPGWMQGVISARNTANFSQEGENWLVEDNNLHHNEHAAINVASGMIVRGNKIHNNGQIGISGLGDSDNHLNDVTIENNEVYNNATNVDGFDFTWHEGGMKFIHAHNLEIINNTIWDNYGRQIFCDVFCDGVLIEGNNIETSEPPARRNRNSPIMYEISSNGTIRNNTIDLTLRTDINDTGVRIAESQNVVVEGNDITVRNPFDLDAWGFDFRSQGGRAPVGNVTYQNNTVDAPDGSVKVGDSNATSATDMYFYNNDYSGDIIFKDNGSTRSWNQWKNQGRDTAGSFTP